MLQLHHPLSQPGLDVNPGGEYLYQAKECKSFIPAKTCGQMNGIGVHAARSKFSHAYLAEGWVIRS